MKFTADEVKKLDEKKQTAIQKNWEAIVTSQFLYLDKDDLKFIFESPAQILRDFEVDDLS